MRLRSIPIASMSATCAVIAAALVLAPAPTVAEELTNEACLACHGTEGFAAEDDRPLFVDGATFDASTHAGLACTACHADIEALPHEQRPGPVALDTCATCHVDAVDAYRDSVHGRAVSHGVREAATCRNCHGDLHAVKPHTESASAVHWSRLATTCARCHSGVDVVHNRIPVVRPVEAYLASAHARALRAGKHAAVCSDCHGAHGILAGDDPRASIWRANIPATCGACHADILATYRDSVHGQALARGVRGAAVCTDCHGEHRILGPSEPASPVFAANIPGETCGRCHADERLSEKYGLPAGRVAAFEDSYHGLALRSGKLTVANCSSCHGVHDIRLSTDPRSHVNPANLPQTCGKCHPGAGTKFALESVHLVASSLTAQIVGWVRGVYLALIAVVIGMMVAHNTLDLSLKARRGTHGAMLAGAVAERMPRPMRWQHGLVMLSFPVLVYTGFALTYPESWWAAPVVHWETTLGLRGLIHRAAAVVLLIALAWHVAHLGASARLRACMRAMLPSPSDLRVVWQTLAYLLGRRAARPHSGTFSYVEKAEYWAFMWGMLLMGATGFLLWFDNLALRYLPKWILDVATALHFYEAMLATLAILVWHFYAVMFDPDVYPMDWTWWDGRPPPARVLERRLEEDGGDGLRNQSPPSGFEGTT